jgi:hypothetical protein
VVPGREKGSLEGDGGHDRRNCGLAPGPPSCERLDVLFAARERRASATRKVFWFCWGQRPRTDEPEWERYVRSIKARHDECHAKWVKKS